MSEQVVKTIGQRIKRASRVLLVSHIRPDGDAIGSLLGLGLALQSAGRQVQMVLSDGVPHSFSHLEGSDQVVNKPDGDFDLIIVLDCSELSRVGRALDGYPAPDVNIDHHVTNVNFAKLNLVDTQAVATAEIIASNLDIWGLPVTRQVSDALLTGLITDTIGFRTSNMTAQALRLAADLIDHGSDLPFLYNKALVQRSFEAARLWGAGLSLLTRQGPLVWTTLTLADRKAARYPGRDDADLVNILSSISDAAVALIFVEQPNGRVKVSWRAQHGFDVSQIAVSFGGGGHPAAAGAEIEGDLESVQNRVIQSTLNALNGAKIPA